MKTYTGLNDNVSLTDFSFFLAGVTQSAQDPLLTDAS